MEEKTIAKAYIRTSYPKPLETLIDICGSIEAPSMSALKKMLRNYKVIKGDLWYSIFMSEWSDFYNLPELFERVAKNYSISHPMLSTLCSNLSREIEECSDNIENAIEAGSASENDNSQKLDELFYTEMVKTLHKRLKRICNQLSQHDSLIIRYLANNPTAKEIPIAPKVVQEELLTETQQTIWDALKGKFMTAKELAKKSDSTEVNVRKIIQKIRGRFGKDSILNTPSRGYWRPNSPPKDTNN